jgi:hypothetical protein
LPGIQRLGVDADRHSARRAQLVDDRQVPGRFDLDLDRQARHRGQDRRHRPDQVSRAAVGPGRRPGRHHHLPDPVEADRGLRHLGQLRRGLGRHRRARAQRLLDRAEPAALVLGVPDAGLHHRRGQHVPAVQARDLLVAHPVGRGQVVERGTPDHVQGQAGVLLAQPQPVVAHLVRARGVDRQGRVAAVDDQVAVVAGAGPGRAAHRCRHPHAAHRQVGPDVEALQSDPGRRVGWLDGHQNMYVELMIAPLRA